MKTLTLMMAVVLLVGSTVGQSTAGEKRPFEAQLKAPTNAEVDAALKRIYGYDPSIQWKIVRMRPSMVPGMNEVFLLLKGEFHHLFLTADGRFAIDGSMQPFGQDPYAGVRDRLKAADGVALGPAVPAVTLVEFSDLQCPHCKEAQPVLEKLASDFPKMRIVVQQYPLSPAHPWAMKAAQYADCVGRMDSSAAWKFIAAVYENQGGIAVATADDKLRELTSAAGLDAGKVTACAAEPATEARIKKSMALGDSVGVLGTPAIYVNGRLLENLVGIPYEQVKAMVQYEIDHAGQ